MPETLVPRRSAAVKVAIGARENGPQACAQAFTARTAWHYWIKKQAGVLRSTIRNWLTGAGWIEEIYPDFDVRMAIFHRVYMALNIMSTDSAWIHAGRTRSSWDIAGQGRYDANDDSDNPAERAKHAARNLWSRGRPFRSPPSVNPWGSLRASTRPRARP